MRFDYFLQESLSRPYNIIPVMRTKNSKSFAFTNDNKETYKIYIDKRKDRYKSLKNVDFPENSLVEISFVKMTKDNDTIKQVIGATGSGDAFRIFATVKSVMNKYVFNNNDILGIIYRAEYEGSRIKLYDRFAKEIERNTNFRLYTKELREDELLYFFIREDVIIE